MLRLLKKKAAAVFDNIVDFFFPLYCCSCEKIMVRSDFPLCSLCRKNISYIRDSDIFNDIICDDICGYFSLGRYEGVLKNLISALKYYKKKHIAYFLADELYSHLMSFYSYNRFSIFDIIIPVPLHEVKLKERGFNQSELIAARISVLSKITLGLDIVFRKRQTFEQNKLHYSERFKNVKDAFEINNKNICQIKSKNVIIVDDIVTTAATVRSMARLLKEHGAFNIFVISAARTAENEKTRK